MRAVRVSFKAMGDFLRILVVGLVVLFENSCFAEEKQNGQPIRFPNRQGGFTITLPSGWKEMPPELSGIFVDPDAVPGHHVRAYGYQPVSSEGLLDTPFVTVHVLRGIRIPERVLAVLTSEDLRRKTLFDQLKREGILERDLIETSYDTNRHVMGMVVTKTEHGNKIRAINSMNYTEEGVITVSCVARDSEFKSWLTTFKQVTSSFEIDSSIRYRARAGAERLNPTMEAAKWRMQIWAFVFIGSIVFYIFRWRQNRVMSDEI